MTGGDRAAEDATGGGRWGEVIRSAHVICIQRAVTWLKGAGLPIARQDYCLMSSVTYKKYLVTSRE
jgi:hypothetical protein